MSIETVEKMSRLEKIKLMELLWDQLSQPDAAFTSPAWHATALAETEQRLAAGQEDVLDWKSAKQELRRRFEAGNAIPVRHLLPA
jgi:hypothetical protein